MTTRRPAAVTHAHGFNDGHVVEAPHTFEQGSCI